MSCGAISSKEIELQDTSWFNTITSIRVPTKHPNCIYGSEDGEKCYLNSMLLLCRQHFYIFDYIIIWSHVVDYNLDFQDVDSILLAADATMFGKCLILSRP